MEESSDLIRFDWFTRNMLWDKSKYKVLEGFLTALLKKDITILNILESKENEDTEKSYKSKFNKVALLVEDDSGEKTIVEIQNVTESEYLERVLVGTSKIIIDYLKILDKCRDITKVISLSILYFNLGTGNDYIYYGTTELYGAHNKEKLQEKSKIVFEYYIINAEMFRDVVEEDIDEWIYMLKNLKIKNEFKSKYIKEAEFHLDIGKLDKKNEGSIKSIWNH